MNPGFVDYSDEITVGVVALITTSPPAQPWSYTMLFATHAPIYWTAGLPVIPVRGKRPVVPGWQLMAERMPTEDEQAAWLKDHADCGLGLPLGKQSGICVLDIDNVRPDHVATIEAEFPSPWRRVGKKGCCLAFRFSGERTFTVKDATGAVLVELLSSKRQMVLPPSIHPDTGKPYTANCDLWEVLGGLPMLPGDVETRLRALLKGLGYDLGGSGNRAKGQATAPVIDQGTGLATDGRNTLAVDIRYQTFLDLGEAPTLEEFAEESFKRFAAVAVVGGRYEWPAWFEECRGEFRRLCSKVKRGLDPSIPPAFPPRPRLPLAEAEQALAAVIYGAVATRRTAAVIATPGLGKTRAMLEAVTAQAGTYHIYAPQHANCEEIAAKLDGAVVVRGRERAGCTQVEAVNSAVQAGLPVKAAVCAACPDRDGCAYLSQFRAEARFWVMPHAYLSLELDKNIPRADYTIVDENPLAELAKVEFIKIAELGGVGAEKLVGWFKNPARETMSHAWLVRQLTTRVELEARRIRECIATGQKSKPDKMIVALQAVIDEWGSNQPLRSVRVNGDNLIVRRWVGCNNLDGPFLLLDATAEPELLRLRWPDMEVHRVEAERKAVVVQEFSNTVSKRALLNGRDRDTLVSKLQRVIDLTAKEHKRGLIVTYKDTKELFNVPEGWGIIHFGGGTRGVNRFEDFTAVVVIGRNQIPEWAVHDEAAAILHGLDAECDFQDRARLQQGYATSGGVEVPTFESPILGAVDRLHRESETLQAVERLRLVRAKDPKTVILACSLPIDLEPVALMPLDDLAAWNPILREFEALDVAAAPLSPGWWVENRGWSGSTFHRHVRELKGGQKGVTLPINISIGKVTPFPIEYRTTGQRGSNTTALVEPGRGVWTVQQALGGNVVSLTEEAKTRIRESQRAAFLDALATLRQPLGLTKYFFKKVC